MIPFGGPQGGMRRDFLEEALIFEPDPKRRRKCVGGNHSRMIRIALGFCKETKGNNNTFSNFCVCCFVILESINTGGTAPPRTSKPTNPGLTPPRSPFIGLLTSTLGHYAPTPVTPGSLARGLETTPVPTDHEIIPTSQPANPASPPSVRETTTISHPWFPCFLCLLANPVPPCDPE